LYLQDAFDLSDEDLVWQWLENPYGQVFSAETHLQAKPAINPSSLTGWRKQLGEAGADELRAETIEAAKRANVIKTPSPKRVIVDMTVMEKAIAHPADSRQLERCREHLVEAAAQHGLKLPQNHNREAPRLAGQIARYAYAKQYKRMKKSRRPLRSRVGRVMRLRLLYAQILVALFSFGAAAPSAAWLHLRDKMNCPGPTKETQCAAARPGKVTDCIEGHVVARPRRSAMLHRARVFAQRR
jgi:hypothetical protein